MRSYFVFLAKLLPKLKEAIFSDGKFNKVRALWLALFFLLITMSIKFVGLNVTEQAIEALDELSDLIGYSN
ncbi:hypothetical protein [Vibrio harveyi]|uniref:hypothetical protein n=1 Tax=Vibrio harveyi TaxID=669 RepID=UPI00039E7E72|nr:hypothetical protein [Vibrio harveyi]MBY7699345.1 hypothetical protein [Vibrio harveyi]PNM62561.1 hypothetical protein AL540_005950 [Vibrio harveyi]UIL56480.1 hypothetical protein LXG94_02275 [Vibrio harveyi]SQA36260.1 Uncharacterised protein [Vibrio harveyi]